MAREERTIIVLLTLGFAALGLWQHLYFSLAVGEFAFFKNAYDEDTYILFPFGISGFRLDRSLSGAIVAACLWLSHGSYSFTLMAFDAVLPPLAFLAAYFIGSDLFKSGWSRALFAMVLVLSADLFSLASIASYPGPFPTLGQFKALIGEALVPPMETSYLGLYRSPEPQVSSVISFIFFGLLLRLTCRDDDQVSRSEVAALLAVQALLMTCYSLVSYPVLLLQGGLAALLLLSGRRRKAILLFTLCGGFALIALVATRLTLGQSTSAVVFASRLPIVTVGIIVSVALTLLALAGLIRNPKSPLLLTAFAFAGFPFALSNQQIVTGIMASAREWERYVNFPCLIIACGLLLASLQWKIIGHRAIAAVMIAAIAAFAVVSSLRTYRLWLPDNLTSLAITRAIQAAKPRLPADATLVLDQPGSATLVDVRLGYNAPFLLTVLDTFKAQIAPSQDFKATPLALSLFEHWRQFGLAPDQARELLMQEAAARAGLYSMFLFNICDHWYPCTDGRNVKTGIIVSQIPQVISAYQAFLAQGVSGRQFAFVSSASPQTQSADTVIGEGRAGDKRAVVFEAK